MFQREQIEQLLRLNGVSVNDSDEEIKSVLISAQWHKDDVEAAVLVLRENKKSHETHVDSLHKVFRTDERLRPETISSLLGIQMDVTAKDIEVRNKRAQGVLSAPQIAKITLMSLILSLVFVLAGMWYLQMGLFYPALL